MFPARNAEQHDKAPYWKTLPRLFKQNSLTVFFCRKL